MFSCFSVRHALRADMFRSAGRPTVDRGGTVIRLTNLLVSEVQLPYARREIRCCDRENLDQARFDTRRGAFLDAG